MRSNVHALPARGTCPQPLSQPARRFVPLRGQRLTVDNIKGPWRPSGSVEACGMFAVVWATRLGEFWAPLHDFTPADQLRLIDACRWLDRAAGYAGGWPDGRFRE